VPAIQCSNHRAKSTESNSSSTMDSLEDASIDTVMANEQKPGKAFHDFVEEETDRMPSKASNSKSALDNSPDINQYEYSSTDKDNASPEISYSPAFDWKIAPPGTNLCLKSVKSHDPHAEDPLVTEPVSDPKASVQEPPYPISAYTRVLTLKEEYELYGSSVDDVSSSKRGNPNDARPIIRHLLCCDNCDRIGHRWMHCPDHCTACGEFHQGYLFCGSRASNRKNDGEVGKEEELEEKERRSY
jgi:hypothetical protein